MLKKLFSVFKNKTSTPLISQEVHEIMTKTLPQSHSLSMYLAGNVKIIVDKQYTEPSMIMNITPSIANLISVTKDAIRFEQQSINMINERIVIDGVAHMKPDFVIYTNTLKNLELDGVADYAVEYIQPEHSLDLTINGVGDVHLHLELYSLDCDIRGVGQCEGLIHTHRLEIDHSGVGDIHFRGSSDRGQIDLDGTGNFNGRDLLIEDGELFINSLGDAFITMKNVSDMSSFDSVGDITIATSTSRKAFKQDGLGDLHIQRLNLDFDCSFKH